MEYTLKGIKTFRGTDGQGLNATLYRDGIKVACVIDEGGGGEMMFEWVDDHKSPLVDVPWVDYQGQPSTIRCTPEEAKLYEFLRGKTWNVGRAFNLPVSEVQTEPFHFVNDLVEDILNDKRFRKLCKTKVLFRLKTDKKGSWRTYKYPFDKKIKDWLVKRFGDQIESIMNETYGQVAQ